MTIAFNHPLNPDVEIPHYAPQGNECALFEHAWTRRLPILLKGPTGCGKTRFVQHMALSPMQYLMHWRMQLAARQMENPQVSLAQIAADVGYESEAAFQRAFKKVVGVPPGLWRRGRSGSLRSLAKA